MPKFEVTHANNSVSTVDADGYTQRDGYFHFTTYVNGDTEQIMSVKESAVIKIEKVD